MAKKFEMYNVEIEIDFYKKLNGETLYKFSHSKKWRLLKNLEDDIFQIFQNEFSVWYWCNNLPYGELGIIHYAPLASEIMEAVDEIVKSVA